MGPRGALLVGRGSSRGAFAGLIVQGIVEALAVLFTGSFSVPLPAILCAIVLWIDRPRPVGRGINVAWIAGSLCPGAYLVGFVVVRMAAEAAR